jgi:hypothetical protein
VGAGIGELLDAIRGIKDGFPSVTKTFPPPSTATPFGSMNCPSAVPLLPQVVRNVPVLVNFWMRLAAPGVQGLPTHSTSVTKTFPLPSTATSRGIWNCPFPVPKLPHEVRSLPLLSNFWTPSSRVLSPGT